MCVCGETDQRRILKDRFTPGSNVFEVTSDRECLTMAKSSEKSSTSKMYRNVNG